MNICLDNNSFPFNIKLFAELRKLLDLNWTDPISEKKHKQTKPNNVITNGKPCIPENRHHNDFRDSFFLYKFVNLLNNTYHFFDLLDLFNKVYTV